MEESSNPLLGNRSLPGRRNPRFPPANLPQWISAGTSVVTVSVALWALFFSPASQALVQYLQSELASRNYKIADLEAQESLLHLAVGRREQELNALGSKANELQGQLTGLASQRDQLQRQIVNLESERDLLASQIKDVDTKLGHTEFSLVKEKLAAQLSSRIIVVWPYNIMDEAYSPHGIRPRKEVLWGAYVSSMREKVNTLTPTEQELGNTVITNFINQCGQLSTISFDIPRLKTIQADFTKRNSLNDLDVKKYDDEIEKNNQDVSKKLDEIEKRVLTAEQDIENCLKGVTP